MNTSYSIVKKVSGINNRSYFGYLFYSHELKDIDYKLIQYLSCVTTLLAMNNCYRNRLRFIIH